MTDGKIVKPNSGWPIQGLRVSRVGPSSINEATIIAGMHVLLLLLLLLLYCLELKF